MNKFTFPIGDWSEDGHSECDEYIAETPLTLEDVREAHFDALEKHGIDIGSICGDYEEVCIYDDMIYKLSDFGVDISEFDTDYMESADVFTLWIRILNVVNPELALTPVKNGHIPMVPFYGFDDKKRHLKSPGYGVFLD